MVCTIISDGSELLTDMKNENEQPYVGMKNRLRDIIWQIYCDGYDEFYLNCEYGVPLWSAEIICGLKMYNDIKLSIVMPYEEQALNWTEEQRDRYFNVHSLADKVIMANTHYHDACYKEADLAMLEKSDMLAAFVSDKNIETISVADKMGIDVYIYNLSEK